SVDFAANDTLNGYINTLLKDLNGLPAGRTAIDAGRSGRTQAADLFSSVIEDQYHMYGSLATLDDQGIARDIRALINASQAREALAQEDAFISGVLSSGKMTLSENREFIRLVGVQRFLFDKVLADLAPSDRQRYQRLQEGSGYVRLHTLENLLIQTGNGPLPLSSLDWDEAATPVQHDLRELELTGGQDVIERATPFATGVIVRLVLAGGLGLIAVISSIILAITTARSLIRQLERLAAAARELADERLPGIVERLGHGERVDVNAEAPPLEFGSDAIGQVGQAFNDVQKTAIHTAVEQAELRQGIRDILLSLARRTQSLVHRQLTLLDTMERRESDAVELKDLFRVDHLATRMRRNAENLIVLSGASAGRAWRRPVPMVDVVRGALAEVEDYTRVTLMPIGPVELAGRAVGDVIHLLAELVENAVSFSPPYTVVQISGQLVANGHVIEIEDRGLGMSPESLAVANERLTHPPEFNPASTAQLGLFVVSHLADRHGVKVALKDSLYGGTTAVVLIPRELIIGEDLSDPDSAPPPAAPLAIGRGSTAENVGPGDLEDPRLTGSTAPKIALAGAKPVSGDPINGQPVSGQPVPEPRIERRPIFTDEENARVVEGKQPGTTDHERPRVIEPDRAQIVEPDHAWFESERPRRPAPDRPRLVRREPPPPEKPPTPPADPEYTPSGLPFRVPQANLAPALRTDPAPVEEPPGTVEDDRSPEDIRRIMGAFQAGTRRGRNDAARAMPQPGEEPRE
ncbi:MAG TPA: nitrate- and nitrite sensing domain-containing protein, partial [Thermopolyspora sp.]